VSFPLRIRKNQQNAFFLIYPREVLQIGILTKTHGAVCIGRHDVVGMKNGHAVIFQKGSEPAPVFDVERWG
jgi:hypothetical protein